MLSEAENILVNVCGGTNMTLNEVQILMEELGRHINDESRILFGTTVDAKLGNRMSVTIISSIGVTENVKVQSKAGGRHAAPVEQPAESKHQPEAVEVTRVTSDTGGMQQTPLIPHPEEITDEGPKPPKATPRAKPVFTKAPKTVEAVPAAPAAPKVPQQKQETLQFEPVTRGRFEKSEPTIVDGQDLDAHVHATQRQGEVIAMRRLPIACVLAMLLSLSGCLPVSVNPLSSLDEATADSRLPGVWCGKSGDDTIFLHFVAGEGMRMQAVEVDHEKTGKAHTTLYNVFISTIGDFRYMNIREGKGEEKPYYFARYKISTSGSLSVWLMSEKSAAKAIKAGKIAGKVVKQSSGDLDVKITDTTKSLAAFVRESDPELVFDQKFATFKKLALPNLEPESAPAPSPGKKSKSGTPAKNRKKAN